LDLFLKPNKMDLSDFNPASPTRLHRLGFTDFNSARYIGYNICMFKFYFNYYKKYVRIVRVQFRRGCDTPRVAPWQTARVIELFYTLTLAMRRAPHAPS
jgi:hypothetical protein